MKDVKNTFIERFSVIIVKSAASHFSLFTFHFAYSVLQKRLPTNSAMIMHCRYSLLRACLLALLISSGNVSAGVSPDNTVQDAISSATKPLHREIESLKELLENIEARHDTLEAATEQFRIKAKSLKAKLQEEKNSYDNLLSLKADDERKLKEETVSVSERLEESESRAASLEKSLEIALAEKKELDSLRHNEANKRIEDSNRCWRILKQGTIL
jgi:hypothetical protein